MSRYSITLLLIIALFATLTVGHWTNMYIKVTTESGKRITSKDLQTKNGFTTGVKIYMEPTVGQSQNAGADWTNKIIWGGVEKSFITSITDCTAIGSNSTSPTPIDVTFVHTEWNSNSTLTYTVGPFLRNQSYHELDCKFTFGSAPLGFGAQNKTNPFGTFIIDIESKDLQHGYWPMRDYNATRTSFQADINPLFLDIFDNTPLHTVGVGVSLINDADCNKINDLLKKMATEEAASYVKERGYKGTPSYKLLGASCGNSTTIPSNFAPKPNITDTMLIQQTPSPTPTPTGRAKAYALYGLDYGKTLDTETSQQISIYLSNYTTTDITIPTDQDFVKGGNFTFTANAVVIPLKCSNGRLDSGGETDVDCGGGAIVANDGTTYTCPRCPTGAKCQIGSDCASSFCTAKGRCPGTNHSSMIYTTFAIIIAFVMAICA